MAGLSLADLKAVSLVGAIGSFRGAAREMDVSVSSLSHQIASVERRVGIRLFNRTTRSVALTEAGAAFLDRVRPALADIDEALAMVDHLRDTPSGVLRLNTSEGGAERVLPLVLDYLQKYPEMRVDLVTEGRLVDIVAEGFDAGLRLPDAIPQDMVAISLGMTEAFVLVASPRYLSGRKPATPGDLLAFECIRARMPSGKPIEWELEKDGETVRVQIGGRLTAGNSELALAAARRDAGIAYVPLRAAEEDLATGRLIQLLSEWTPPYPGLSLYYPNRKLPSAGLRAFIKHVIDARRGGGPDTPGNQAIPSAGVHGDAGVGDP